MIKVNFNLISNVVSLNDCQVGKHYCYCDLHSEVAALKFPRYRVKK